MLKCVGRGCSNRRVPMVSLAIARVILYDDSVMIAGALGMAGIVAAAAMPDVLWMWLVVNVQQKIL